MSSAARASAEGVVGRSLAGAALAAVVVGLGEAAIVIAERHLGIDFGLLFFAFLFYGGIGALIGLGIGLGLRVVTRASAATGFALSGAAVLAVLVTIIGRFRIFRDVFNETFDGGADLALHVPDRLGGGGGRALRGRVRRCGGRWRAGVPVLASPVVVIGALVVAVVASRAGMALGSAAKAPPARVAIGAPAKGPNVILIVVDTLRADHLSCYGAAQPDAGDRRPRGGRHALRARLFASLVDAALVRRRSSRRSIPRRTARSTNPTPFRTRS